MTIRLALALVLAAGPLAGQSGDDDLEAIAAQLEADSEAARALAVRRLRNVEPARADPLLERAAADGSAGVRVEVLELYFDRDPAAAALRYRPGLADQPPPVRRSFHARLAGLADPATIDDLLGGLDDPSPRVRQEAARALARRTGQALPFDPDGPAGERTAAAAAWRAWWAASRDRSPVEIHRAALAADEAARRLGAVRGLAALDDDDVVDDLIESLADPASTVRTAARDALRRRTLRDFDLDPAADPEEAIAGREAWRRWWLANRGRTPEVRLREALEDDSARTRGQACLRLAEGEDPASIELLIDRLADRSSMVRQRADRALRTLTALSFEFDADAPADERAAATLRWRRWNERRPPSRRAWLLEALHGPTPSNRARAARALGRSGDETVIGDLLHRLDDDAGGVREAAAGAVGRLAGREFDYDPDADRPARREAIERIAAWWRGR